MNTGTCTDSDLRTLITSQHIAADIPIADAQIQPASLDLRLGTECWRMPGSTLPQAGEQVRDLIERFAIEALDLSQPTCLQRGGVYLVRLQEHLQLPAGMEAYTNAKSSVGRIDLATRVLSDGNARYDRIAPGYAGELWLELIPRSFDIRLRAGICLNQAIVFADRQVLTQRELLSAHAEQALAYDGDGQAIAEAISDGRLLLRADLQADPVGYVARRSLTPLDLLGPAQAGQLFFEPIPRPRDGCLFLEKDRFYILASLERILVPLHLACEMVPYDPAAGEFRAHYAGFFDPGFGVRSSGSPGTRAVLEVRPHEDDLILRHGQPICAMAYERLTRPCDQAYGGGGSHYATQDGPRLSKYLM
ncbi:MAG: 2'-deoxycytidine 5'-triphosphate deaminase [Planctomycetota bacterium]